MKKKLEEYSLSDIQKQVLDGAMLGDGCLYKHKNCKDAQLIYSSKSKQHVEFIENYFKDAGSGITEYCIADKRTAKNYSGASFKTYTNQVFTEQYNRWYINGVKHLPKDLKLTPLICLIWYIGDGGIIHANGSEYIKLATHCFEKEEQEQVLLSQLKMFNPHLVKTETGRWFIYIPRTSEDDFLNFIGECPFDDYNYKWDIKSYKSVKPTKHKVDEQNFCELYKAGVPYYEIAKQYNIDASAVRYYLIKNNIYESQKDSKLKNCVIQYSNNIPINIYISSYEASRVTNILNTGISQVINNKRKLAGGYMWKKYLNLSEQEKEIIQNKFNDYFI